MTGLLTVKLRRDLRAMWSRFLLMVVAIAVSLTAFGAVLFAWATSGRETSGAYASTAPASATIVLDEAIDAQRMATIVAAVRTRPQVIDATGRTQFTGAVEIDGRALDIPLQVFAAAPDDPLRVARFFMDRRSWPPAAGEVYVGRDGLSLLGVAVGDTLTVETPSGDLLRLRVADTVYDPSLSPSPQEQTARGYVSTASLATADAPALLDQVKIQVAAADGAAPSRDRAAIVAAAGDVGAWLQREHGVRILEVQVPEPYAHPHQWQADALLVSLLAGGAAALLLSTILVANMLNTLFTQQVPQIGIMKAIGARSGRVGGHYLALVLLVASAATLVALGPAILLGRVAVGMFVGFLGIQPASLAAPAWTYAVVVAVGFGLPPLMAVPPLVRASRITVRAAIDHHGGGASPGAPAGILARLGRVGRLDGGLRMALRNTVRRPARFLLSVGLLATAGTVFVAGMSLRTGTEAVVEEQTAQRNWDVDVQLAAPASAREVARVVERLPGVARFEGFSVVQTGVAGPGRIPFSRTYPDQGHGRVSVTALPARPLLFPLPELVEGRWLQPGDAGVVLNQNTRDIVPDVDVGEDVQLVVGGRSTTWRVIGIVQERMGAGRVYTTAEAFAAATGGQEQVNQLRIATDRHDEHARQQVAAAADRALTDAGVEVRSAASVSRMEAISSGHMGPIILILLGIALPLGVVGVIGLASTMTANVLDRTREFGVMHAIGARPSAVRRVVVAEGVFLALASCLAAVVPALALTALLGAGLGNLFFDAPLPFRVSTLAVGIWLVLVVLGAVLATDAAAARASRITVREALAYL
jgi:putative ABC transport system permease protein